MCSHGHEFREVLEEGGLFIDIANKLVRLRYLVVLLRLTNVQLAINQEREEIEKFRKFLTKKKHSTSTGNHRTMVVFTCRTLMTC